MRLIYVQGQWRSKILCQSFRSSFAYHLYPHLLPSLLPLMCIKKDLVCYLGRLLNSPSKMFLCEILYSLKFDIS